MIYIYPPPLFYPSQVSEEAEKQIFLFQNLDTLRNIHEKIFVLDNHFSLIKNKLLTL